MVTERESMTLNEVGARALGVEERSDETPRARASGAKPAPDPEVVAKPKRRQFTAEYRLRILEEADRCVQPGEVGRLLRRDEFLRPARGRAQRPVGAPCQAAHRRYDHRDPAGTRRLHRTVPAVHGGQAGGRGRCHHRHPRPGRGADRRAGLGAGARRQGIHCQAQSEPADLRGLPYGPECRRGVAGGSLVKVQRATSGGNSRWLLRIRPDQGADVGISIPQGALRTTNSGQTLSHALSATVCGRNSIVVSIDPPADKVCESERQMLFTIRLSRASGQSGSASGFARRRAR